MGEASEGKKTRRKNETGNKEREDGVKEKVREKKSRKGGISTVEITIKEEGRRQREKENRKAKRTERM